MELHLEEDSLWFYIIIFIQTQQPFFNIQPDFPCLV